MAQHHYRTCNLCEAMCGIVVDHDGDQILGIRGDDDDPFSRGHLCPKAVALRDIQEDPDRLRQPVRRVGDRFEPIGWEDAFELAEREIARVRREHGRQAIASYVGNPTTHSLGAMLFLPFFLGALGTKNHFSASSVDQLPHHVAAARMFGHALLLPVPDLDRTDHLIILGANPAVSKGSLLSAGDVMARIEAIRERGGRVTVVDPRRTATARKASEHVFIRPGTDSLLLAALLHVLFREGLVRLGRLAPHVRGVDELGALVAPYSPERVARATGVAAAVTERLAREFARARHAVAYGRIGVSLQAHGTLACYLTTALNVVTGNFDEPGGAMFTTPAIDVVKLTGSVGFGARELGRWRSRVRGLPEVGGELPVATLIDELETAGSGQVKALITHAGNPVLSTPNGPRLERALKGLEFFLAIDLYVNETTRHAQLILPPTGPLQRPHYDVVFQALAVRNGAKFSKALLARGEDERHDWEIMNELSMRLVAGSAKRRILTHARARAMAALGPRGLVDLALRIGPYGPRLRPLRRGLSVAALEASPHGIDLGPLEPRLPGVLRTRDRRVDLAPPAFVADAARLEALVAEAPEGLVLIGRRDLRSNNSWMHNTERLMRGRPRCTLLMHPEDARARGLITGRDARVATASGSIVVPVEVTEEVMLGVVSLPHGFGHGRPGVRLRVATQHAGASYNDLTDGERIDPASGNAALNAVAVEVEPA